ncbi:iron-containing alcohol dehydrogenase [bacterium]|nr:iron-containing alcohol dehydrogenase [bacterium]
MWFFSSPSIVFGEDALSYLEELPGRCALIVTDPTLHRLGFSERIIERLKMAGVDSEVFAEVEPEPSVQTVYRGVDVLNRLQPDWIIGLGGGSPMDAAKAMWALYERPDLTPEEISPVYALGLHKLKMIAIPTTSGTGSEATWATVLTDVEEKRKLGLGNRELTPTLAIVDPSLTADLPAHITADTGLDALTHAIEGYSATFHSDFTDPLCLKAAELVFAYLPRAVENGSGDPEAREKMANAATIAGLGFGNSLVGLAHALGHSLGAAFHIPHGRAVSLFLPYIMEFNVNGGVGRYDDIAYALRMHAADAPCALIELVRVLQKRIGQPTTLAELGISAAQLEDAMDVLCTHAITDNSIVAAPRPMEWEEAEKFYLYAFEGKSVDF